MMDFLSLMLDPLREMLARFREFVPNLLAMLVIFAVGIVVAIAFRLVLVKVLTAIKFDSWSDRMGFTTLMRKGDLWAKPSYAAGAIAFWVLIIITLMVGLGALRVAAIDHLVDQFFSYLPRVLSAAVVLVVGYMIASFISRAVLIAAANGGFHYAKLLAEAVRVLLIVMILAMVLEQLQIATNIVLAAFSIVFGGIVIALAIAFGVGGIDAAKRIIEREITPEKKEEVTNEEMKKEEPKKDIEHL